MKKLFFILILGSVSGLTTYASESCSLSEVKYIKTFNGNDYTSEKFYFSNCQNDSQKNVITEYQASSLGQNAFLGLINLYVSNGFTVTGCQSMSEPSSVTRINRIDTQICLAYKK